MNKRVTVFLSSSPHLSPMLLNEIQEMGRALARAQMTVVYGGAHTGAMGSLADAILEENGTLIGIIPNSHTREWGHTGLNELIEVLNLAERKAKMIGMGDAILVLPGGIGTLDEMTDVLALMQLGLCNKPLVLFNCLNYWEPFLQCLQLFEQQATISSEALSHFQVYDRVEGVIDYLKSIS